MALPIIKAVRAAARTAAIIAVIILIAHGVGEPVAAACDVVTVVDPVMVGKAVVLVVGVMVVGLGGDTVVNVPVTQALVIVIALERTLQ